MISIDVERVENIRGELEPLLRLHWEEIALDKEKIPLDVDWESYLAMEKLGNLLTLTARVNKELIGYSIWFIRNHLHYRQTKWAYNDVIFLKKEYRNQGNGVFLIKVCEDVLREMGVNKVQWHIKATNNWTQMLVNRGYEIEDYVVGKYLGE